MFRIVLATAALPLLGCLGVSAAAQAAEPAAATTTPVAAAPNALTDPDDVIKCRMIKVTGSRLAGERVCKPVGEWRRLRERGSEAARDIVDYSRSRPGGQ
ncbi:hypothetical protein ACLIMP_13675 [Novosphingobium aerophilum]|uniref:hypothetical protein n=1 Tax=Novosphingobium TaxID=165696 RepID=UPI002D7A2327|nr:hypothetical protein [Novosphingobium sp. RL4]WRT92307.1 hypothetical protein U9J33_14000 [Novosphingobium sp. RL4]